MIIRLGAIVSFRKPVLLLRCSDIPVVGCNSVIVNPRNACRIESCSIPVAELLWRDVIAVRDHVLGEVHAGSGVRDMVPYQSDVLRYDCDSMVGWILATGKAAYPRALSGSDDPGRHRRC